MSWRKSKTEILVQMVSRDERSLRPLGKDRRNAIVESAKVPLLSLDEALRAGKFNRGGDQATDRCVGHCKTHSFGGR